ncbi:SH3 domain-containing protein [Konateibacter massiliensis]|uniref:SH3 domain-containing protein n=1 Tax=Konateibacter massiliensis TaxID=2002841 RepID=UPI0015D4FF80|nr:SH3 domain-containing protein [Konateibacter massiliensis]
MKLNFENIKTFLIKNKKYVLIGAIFIVMVFTLVRVSSGNASKEAEEAKSEEVIKVDETTAQEPAETEEAATNDLLTDAYPEVNDLINRYFTAMASGDIDTLLQIQNPLSEEEQAQVLQKMEYIEGYNNITVYTKIGPTENSYIVFAYYEIKFINIDTLVPGETPLYVCTNDDGSLYIYNGELSPEESTYLSDITSGQDVLDLINSIETKFAEAQEADPDLKAFIQKLSGTTEEAAEEETTEEEQPAEEPAVEEEPAAEETNADGMQVVDETVYAAETINIRESDNQDSARIGQLYMGDSAKRTAIYSNGWSQIEYNGQTGYVLTEYLTDTGALQEVKYLTSTVNIRAEADESSSRVGTAYLGAKVTRTAVLDNGWSRINSDGVVGYVKSEYLADTYN